MLLLLIGIRTYGNFRAGFQQKCLHNGDMGLKNSDHDLGTHGFLGGLLYLGEVSFINLDGPSNFMSKHINLLH